MSARGSSYHSKTLTHKRTVVLAHALLGPKDPMYLANEALYSASAVEYSPLSKADLRVRQWVRESSAGRMCSAFATAGKTGVAS